MIDGNNPPIFIVGAPRSGTHLLRYCLNQHKDIYILPETRYFFNIYGNRNLILGSLSNKISKLIQFTYNSGDPSMKEFEPLRDSIIEKSNILGKDLNFTSFFEIIMSKFAEYKGKVRYGEKTPNHLFYINHILKLFPHAKILFINRSIKNVMASYLKSSHMPNNFIHALAQNLHSREATIKYTHKGLLINYEDLTSNPRKILEKVCSFIEVDFQEEMLKPKMLDSSYSDKVMKFDNNIGILPNDPDKWKSVLSDLESNIIDFYFDNKNDQELKPSAIFRFRVYYSTLMYKIRMKKNYFGFENILRGLIN